MTRPADPEARAIAKFRHFAQLLARQSAREALRCGALWAISTATGSGLAPILPSAAVGD